MRIGNLRNYVTIQKPTETFDSNLELITTWSTFATVWASIEPLIGREFWASRQVSAETTGKIRIRYLSGLTPKMRILDGSTIYEIEAVINVNNKNEEIVLLVKEKL